MNDQHSNPLQQWADQNWNQFQQRQQAQTFGNSYVSPHYYGGYGGGCPSCGYCQHCGRGGPWGRGLIQWQASGLMTTAGQM